MDLKPIILHEQANSGVKSIINKLETYSDVRCAIILMTADDKGKAKEEKPYKDRARQNVVFEAGYFIEKLEPQNVILLYEEGIEMPGDLGGCVYIEPKFPRPLYLGGRGKLYLHSLKNKFLPRSNLSKQLFSILKYDHL